MSPRTDKESESFDTIFFPRVVRRQLVLVPRFDRDVRGYGCIARPCPPTATLLFHVTPVPTSSRFRYVFHKSLPGLQGHLSKEIARAFPHFFRLKVFFVGRQVPLVAEWVSELPASIAPEHIRHRHIRFRPG